MYLPLYGWVVAGVAAVLAILFLLRIGIYYWFNLRIKRHGAAEYWKGAASYWERQYAAIAKPLDWFVWGVLLFFRKSTWLWIGKGFPRLKAHFSSASTATYTFWGLAIIAAIIGVWWGPIWYANSLDASSLPIPGTEIAPAKPVEALRLEKAEGFRLLIVQVTGGLLLLFGLARGWLELRLNREGQITERFTRSVDQLGHENLDVRLGGIFALERIAQDYREYHRMVMEVLTAYVRGRAPWPPKGWRLTEEDAKEAGIDYDSQPTHVVVGMDKDGIDVKEEIPTLGTKAKSQMKPAQDIQTVMTVLGRRKLAHEEPLPGKEQKQQILDLRRTCLVGVELHEAHLEYAKLMYAHLEHANLWYAHVEYAHLEYGHLEHAWLGGAHLEHTNLYHAHLEDAYLREAHLEDAQLFSARLENAMLLTWEQLESAMSFWSATLPSYLTYTPEKYARAEAGDANLDGVPVPEGYEEYIAAQEAGAQPKAPDDAADEGDAAGTND